MDGTISKIQNIFKSAYLSLCSKFYLQDKDRKAIYKIINCRSEGAGSEIFVCPDGHEEKEIFHSCRHRSCPVCNQTEREHWAEKEITKILNCPHYHTVFTLPHEYHKLWRFNQKWFVDHQFKATQETLKELLNDVKYLGANPGILIAHHSWGRDLSLHPHMHCLVTAGGLDKNNKWKASRDNFLLPVKVVKAKYRGKMQAFIKEGIDTGELLLPQQGKGDLYKIYRQAYKKEWSVRIMEKYEHGIGVLKYLARYVKGGPIKDHQILTMNSKTISLQYKDHKSGLYKVLHLEPIKFLRRLLLHVAVPGCHVVRHYGVYASKKQLEAARTQLPPKFLLPNAARLAQHDELLEQVKAFKCSCCGLSLINARLLPTHAEKENSFIKKDSAFSWLIPVQQVDQPDALVYGLT